MRKMEVGSMLLATSIWCALAKEVPQCNELLRTSSGGIITSVNYNRRLLEEHVVGDCTYTVVSSNNYLQFHMEHTLGDNDNSSNDATCMDDGLFACCRQLRLAVRSKQEARVLCAHNASDAPHELRGAAFVIAFATSALHPHAVRVAFTTSRSCKSDQYECADGSGCYRKEEICDRYAHCADGSDETRCARRACRNFFTDDAFFLCANGRCVRAAALRDGVDDCGDGSDERTSSTMMAAATTTPTSSPDTYFALILIALALTFVGLTMRWCLNRRDMRNELNHLPDFPLPPFAGPGEQERASASGADEGGGEPEQPPPAGRSTIGRIDEYIEGMGMQQAEQRSSKRTSSNKRPSDCGDDSVAGMRSLSVDGGDQQPAADSALGRPSKQMRRDSLMDIQELDDTPPTPQPVVVVVAPAEPRTSVTLTERASQTDTIPRRVRSHGDAADRRMSTYVTNLSSKSSRSQSAAKAQEVSFVQALMEINDSLSSKHSTKISQGSKPSRKT